MTPEQLTQLHMMVTQYHELVAHVAQHGDDQEGIHLQFENMLSAALAAFAHDVDSVTPEAASRLIYQIHNTPNMQELAQKGLTPFSCPITVEEFSQQTAGMIPLMLVKACLSRHFHNMLAPSCATSPAFQKFVQLYARKLPSV
jgi:intracellular sulfur oxidation DsrE/DsrF family protein